MLGPAGIRKPLARVRARNVNSELGIQTPGPSETERNSSMACASRDGPVGRQMKPRVTVQGD